MPVARIARRLNDETQLEPLAQVVEMQMPHLAGHYEATAERTRGSFLRSLELLADQYAERRRRADRTAEAEARFKAIASAAKQLRLAVEELSADDLDKLGVEQRQAFEGQQSELIEEEMYDLAAEYESHNEPFMPRCASEMRARRDLFWLEQGAVRLIPRRERGRPKMVAEQWAAERFAILCHMHGWAPLTLSNSGTERRKASKSVPSPAAVCLAAVFRAAGVDLGRELVRATSALKALRSDRTHDIRRESSADWEVEPELDRYKISLKQVEPVRINGADPLPNFIPRTK